MYACTNFLHACSQYIKSTFIPSGLPHVAARCSVLQHALLQSIRGKPKLPSYRNAGNEQHQKQAHHDINLDMHKFLSVVILQYKHTERERERERERETHTHTRH